MPARRDLDRIASFNFQVEIEGVTQGPFLEVEGLESITDVATVRIGNDLLHHHQAGQTDYSNLILRRGFTNNDDLLNWRKAVIDGTVDRKTGTIIILDQRGREIMRFNFFEAWPCRWKLGKLSSLTDGPLVEEVEIVIEKFEKG